ncbi:glycosyltransferase family 4 protein [Citreimonas salinaria]|uniref:Glycosyltransferase involved in cell wall bisynthesis n=1 Tax=Citreimonas salinaria TaxID=321339 RepID=A0A1H3KXG4_9RHOB|nr:glycosyltransferase family 4 protein [Citreimonas salinaria]SDY56418.1 Glycosyltransferase involved in cell wall bisynthesis [Citreimonas salinaria]
MKPTILLITKDAPTPDRRKAGLFPVAIRHHLSLDANVLLYAIEDGLGSKTAELSGFHGLTYVNAEMRAPGALIARWPRLAAQHRVRQLIKAARANRVAAVCGLQSAPQSGLLAQRIANGIKRPFASWEHLTSYGRRDVVLDDRALGHFFRNSGATAAVSGGTLQAIEQRFGLSLSNGVTIPNPVPDDFEFLEPPQPNRYTSLCTGHFTFGAWTNWRDIKRLDLLLDAFGRIAPDRPDARLIVAGPMPEANQQTIASHTASERIVRLGNISREDIRHLAHAVDCCCLPSDHETFGLPVVEALAAGRPVISTRTVGPTELLSGQPTLGQLVPRNDAAAFATAMISAMDNAHLVEPEQLRAHAIRTCGSEAQIDRWRSFYRGLGLSV